MASAPTVQAGSSASFHILSVVFFLLCLGIAGTAGYAKFRLDDVSQDSSVPSSKNIASLAISKLGYGGFVDSARLYMSRMDRAALVKMRQSYEEARDAAGKLSQTASSTQRREIDSIMAIYNDILVRAETSGDAFNSGLTPADLILAANAASALEARIQTLSPKQEQARKVDAATWTMVLTLSAMAGAFIGLTLLLWKIGQRSTNGAALADSSGKANLDDNKEYLNRLDEVAPRLQGSAQNIMQAAHLADVQIAHALSHILKMERDLREATETNNATMERLAGNAENAANRAASLYVKMQANGDKFEAAAGDMRVLVGQTYAHFQEKAETNRVLLDQITALCRLLEGRNSRVSDEEVKQMIVLHVDEALGRVQEVLNLNTEQSENRHAELVRLLAWQQEAIEMRLATLEKNMSELGSPLVDNEANEQIEAKKNDIMNSMIKAIAQLNEHVGVLYGEVEKMEARSNVSQPRAMGDVW
ncbi:MAG: hypothetical protein RBT70_07660 [Alphaproteobacteria bacterium]|jgi:hypothetical protein|nr:hypothetical protein [Alphaproteobacteria bacterium]